MFKKAFFFVIVFSMFLFAGCSFQANNDKETAKNGITFETFENIIIGESTLDDLRKIDLPNNAIFALSALGFQYTIPTKDNCEIVIGIDHNEIVRYITLYDENDIILRKRDVK